MILIINAAINDWPNLIYISNEDVSMIDESC